MSKAAAKTGLGPTVSVAIEQYFPEEQRIITDPLAYAILPISMRVLVWLTRFQPIRNWMIRSVEKSAPGLWNGVMCRKRYIDDRLARDMIEMEAAVNLGAGFDTRAYRLPELKDVPVWEVDQTDNIEAKQERLEKGFGVLPDHVTLVPMNFDQEELIQVLEENGYSTDKKTFFIMEAVTQYLTEEGITSAFDFLATASPGSRLVFTYVLKDFIEGNKSRDQQSLYDEWVVQKKAWLFGLDPREVADFLDTYGWKIIEDLGYDELAERYVISTVRDETFMEIERMVYAEKV